MPGRRIAVYLRDDQWGLIDDLIRSASDQILHDAEVEKRKYGSICNASRIALYWCDNSIAEIRLEIQKRRDANG